MKAISVNHNQNLWKHNYLTLLEMLQGIYVLFFFFNFIKFIRMRIQRRALGRDKKTWGQDH
jgi:hypothetical protein